MLCLTVGEQKAVGFGLETDFFLPSCTMLELEREVEASDDVWRKHVIQQTCSPECTKQFSTWVMTVKPQTPQPTIITSETRAWLLTQIFHRFCAVFNCFWNYKEVISGVSCCHDRHCLAWVLALDDDDEGFSRLKRDKKIWHFFTQWGR